MNNFTHNLKKLRAEKGFTQVKLADDLIISPKRLAAWEEGRGKPDFDKLIVLADYFKITIDQLIR